MKQALTNFLIFTCTGSVIYTIFITLYTSSFDLRMPVLTEFFPLIAVLLTGVTLFLRDNRKS